MGFSSASANGTLDVMRKLFLNVAVFLLTVLASQAQTLDEIDRMLGEMKLTQARDAVGRLLKEQPDNADLLARWGFVLVLESSLVKDPQRAKALRKEGRAVLKKAYDKGCHDEMVIEFLKGIPENGGEVVAASANGEAQKELDAAEAAFAKQQFPEAIAHYQKAAVLDPQLYEAPLYEGDSWFRLRELDKACAAYERATLIEPDQETAYRYWGDALILKGQPDAALERYAQAVVCDPNSAYAWKRGLERWAEVTGGTVKLPSITPACGVGKDGKTILVDGSAPQDLAAAWLPYAMQKIVWRQERFAQRYPGQTYRVTLAEEVEALSAVAEVTEELRAKGELKPDEDLFLVTELKKDGLLEPFVLYTAGTQSIGSEYLEYRKAHRAKLIRFLTTYVARRKDAPPPIKRDELS